MLTFDTKAVLVCPSCGKQLQIDMKMTIADWLIQTVIYAPLLVYGLDVSLWLSRLLPQLQVTLFVLWFITLLVVGRVLWRVFCSSIKPWQPRCLRCDYDLQGLDHYQCPECGKDNDPKQSWSHEIGIARFGRYVLGSTLSLWGLFAIVSLVGTYVHKGMIRPTGFPFGVVAILNRGRAMRLGGGGKIASYDWQWAQMCNDLSVCLLLGFLLALVLMQSFIDRQNKTAD
ncbi:MAG: hypothetical protein ACF8OB_03085 [Phycisphaeraceae bacterium JB051]